MEQEKTLLRHLRRAREITLAKLSTDTGIDEATLSLGERRLRKLSDENLEKLAAYFNAPKDALLEDFSKTVAA